MTGTRTANVAEAAAALGLTPDAIRSRLKRGTLQGEKVNDEWVVTLTEDEATGQQAVGDGQATAQLAEAKAAHVTARLAEAARQVEWLQGRIEALEAALAAEREGRDEDRRRADTVLMSTLALVPRQLEDSHTKRPWWKPWGRP